MRVFITGAAGFVGSHLSERFLKEGYSVLGVDNFLTGRESNLSEAMKHPNFRFEKADVVKRFDFKNPFGGNFSWVLHFACPASPIDFDQLAIEQQDETLKRIESGEIKFDGVDAQGFFSALLKDVPEGFFCDPIHGGNRDMVGWKMIGFPGIRYDYRDWIGRHNERYPYPPVSVAGRADWTPHKP